MLYDYYKILGVSQTASTHEIRRAYREKAKRYHPDINSAEKAHELFAVLNNAHATLTDDGKRKLYDLKLHYRTFYNNPEAHSQSGNRSEQGGRHQARYTRPHYVRKDETEESFEPNNFLFYSFFSAGTLCGLVFFLVPATLFLFDFWNPILLAPLIFGLIIVREGISQMIINYKQGRVK